MPQTSCKITFNENGCSFSRAFSPLLTCNDKLFWFNLNFNSLIQRHLIRVRVLRVKMVVSVSAKAPYIYVPAPKDSRDNDVKDES